MLLGLTVEKSDFRILGLLLSLHLFEVDCKLLQLLLLALELFLELSQFLLLALKFVDSLLDLLLSLLEFNRGLVDLGRDILEGDRVCDQRPILILEGWGFGSGRLCGSSEVLFPLL